MNRIKHVIIASLLFGASGFNSAKAITADELLATIVVPVYQFVIDTFTLVGQVLVDHEARIGNNDARIAALETTYSIGDIGPAGGWVFYITNDGLHGLEAAPVDQADAQWGCPIIGTASRALSTAIGNGARNTDYLLSRCGSITGAAAFLAGNYVSPNGYFDWYLPSKDELNLMYLNIGQGNIALGNVGGFTGGAYWSSTEAFGNAWYQIFDSGIQDSGGTSLRGVRAIRAF